MTKVVEKRITFDDFFRRGTRLDVDPYAYQRRLASSKQFPDVLDVPTGLGKTAAVILAWLWSRVFHEKPNVPRRLVYCLPMRCLVSQTKEAATRWTRNLSEAGLLREPCDVYPLMGGEQDAGWELNPEKNAIIVGTQDMLLSRLLNRGYGMSRYRWPMHFGLLGNDCLWAMDEVQLMGSGLATTVQIDAFQKKLWPPARPCHFLWMSATLGESLLRTKDREDLELAEMEPSRILSLTEDEKLEPGIKARLRAEKTIELRNDPPPIYSKDKSGILDRHEPGRLSLLILNTVPVAQSRFREVQSALAAGKNPNEERPPAAILIHSRYRPPDRQRQMHTLARFVEQQNSGGGVVSGDPGLVVVSTQVIEAGLDVSSARLWSEIAPWPSDIQRLGRLNREGKQVDATAVFWMPRNKEENAKGAPNESKVNQERIGPYLKRDLETAKKLLESVRESMRTGGGSLPYRQALDAALNTDESKTALQVRYESVIRPHDFLDLFATEPDLAGGFTDVSRFVRDADRNMDVYVFWRDDRVREDDEPFPSANEICPVPFYSLQQFLGKSGTAREWDSESGKWSKRRSTEVRPGMTLRLRRDQGGYSSELGWTGNRADKPTVDQTTTLSRPDKMMAENASGGPAWVSLADHTADVVAETKALVQSLELDESFWGVTLCEAAPWHDVGKASVRWKAAVERYLARLRQKVELCRQNEGDPTVGLLLDEFATILSAPCDNYWAKFPDIDWWLNQKDLPTDRRKELRRNIYTPFQPGFRHEAVSALVALTARQRGHAPSLSDLAIYLDATHHGKVRTVLRSIGGTDSVFGIAEGEVLPPIDGLLRTNTPISTESRRFGANGEWDDEGGSFRVAGLSWVSMVADLLGGLPTEPGAVDSTIPQAQRDKAIGPFSLAFLETLLRVADARASACPGRGAR
jgi:CRISPR-associated endonuclease/helicase Cas3